VSLSNLQRQILYSVEDIGKLKCQVASQKCAKLNPHVHFEDHNILLDSNNGADIIRHYDIVIDATDNFETRYSINDICIATEKPFIYGSIHAHEGQVAVFNTRSTSGTPTPSYRSLFPIPPEPNSIPTCATGGVIGALAGVIGSIQAIEAIKLILHQETALSGKLLRIDALTWNIRQYQMVNEEAPQDCDPVLIDMEKIKHLQKENAKILFIDLRDGNDLPLKFPDALRIPFAQLTASPTVPKDNYIVLYCHRGIMSAQAAKILRNQFKYPRVYALVQ
jgi:adenylyltransferase/sulfurtransferase